MLNANNLSIHRADTPICPTNNSSTCQLVNLSTHQLVNSSTHNYFAKLYFLFHRAFGKSHIIVKKSK